MASEEAARVFAEAGELDVAREYERRLAEHRARAAAPLERVIARLEDPNADVGELLAGAGRLVALGEGGRTAMLLAAERHRGFWELANLIAQLDAMDLPAARTLRDACEARARVDKETCVLDDALAQARRRVRSGERDASDLAEAVLVHHLSSRCRMPAFGAAARRWASSKPEPIARALASRIATL